MGRSEGVVGDLKTAQDFKTEAVSGTMSKHRIGPQAIEVNAQVVVLDDYKLKEISEMGSYSGEL